MLHFDGFAPFTQRPDDFTVDYLLLRPILEHNKGCSQHFVKPWVIWDGPRAMRSLQPVTEYCRGQLQDLLNKGVSVPWPLGASCKEGDEFLVEAKQEVTVRFLVGVFVGDQPATDTFNGNGGHASLCGCRFGGVSGICQGSTLARDRAEDPNFDPKSLEALVPKKNNNVPSDQQV